MSTSPHDLAALLREHAERRVPRVPLLPVAAPLTKLLPAGGLRRGSVVTVERSAGTLLALLAAASADGAWCALVGMGDAGLLAAADLGVDLDRLALIPDPGPDWLSVAAALVDAFDLVLLAPAGTAAPAQARRLAARVRERGVVLIVQGSWPGAEVDLRTVDIRWEGIGSGHGRLTGYELEVESRGRGAAGRPRRARVRLGGVDAPPAPLPSHGRAA